MGGVDYYTSEGNPLGDRARWARMCRAGIFPARKIGRQWMVRRGDFDAWFDQAHPAPSADPLAEAARLAGVDLA